MKAKLSLLVIVTIITILCSLSVYSAAENLPNLNEKTANLQERLAAAGVEVDTNGLDDTQAEQAVNKAVKDYVAKHDAEATKDCTAIDAFLQEQVTILKAKLQDVGLEVNTDELNAEEANIAMRTAYSAYISNLQTQPQPTVTEVPINSNGTQAYIDALKQKLAALGVIVDLNGMTPKQALQAIEEAIIAYRNSIAS